MEMQESLADNIVLNASRDIGGHQEVSMYDALSSAGIASDAQLAQLIQLIIQAAARAGFGITTKTLGAITPDSSVLQLRDMVLTAVSAPKKCRDGHIIPAGKIFCAFGHPAQN